LEKVRSLQELVYTLSDLDDEVATLFGKSKAVLRKQGVTIGDIDLLIGSVAVVRGFILVTNNIRHYQHIPDLNSENWSTPRTA
jgi:predicted nucleic acid-binding protein